ncbi:unnamed protein product [Chondrus crispus]|uniref:Uncharacterized protein n=1 Tax=Chondrus crispus TaxID=2769 RepID=S0F3K5_CHOCR|nr:unnamed protein product [Chondrus crispus]CDF77484.1 unnamed protein product [Chondrus crispus]|eukprot:XP_005712523.1 unnamed protein product [Chondrus crispus]
MTEKLRPRTPTPDGRHTTPNRSTPLYAPLHTTPHREHPPPAGHDPDESLAKSCCYHLYSYKKKSDTFSPPSSPSPFSSSVLIHLSLRLQSPKAVSLVKRLVAIPLNHGLRRKRCLIAQLKSTGKLLKAAVLHQPVLDDIKLLHEDLVHERVAAAAAGRVDLGQRGEHGARKVVRARVVLDGKVRAEAGDDLDQRGRLVRPLQVDDDLVALGDLAHGVLVRVLVRALRERHARAVVRVQRVDRVRGDVLLVAADLARDLVGVRDGRKVLVAVGLQVGREDDVPGVARAGHEGDVAAAHVGDVQVALADQARVAAVEVDVAALDDGAPPHLVPLDHVEAVRRDEAGVVQRVPHGDAHRRAARLGRPVVEQQPLVRRGRPQRRQPPQVLEVARELRVEGRHVARRAEHEEGRGRGDGDEHGHRHRLRQRACARRRRRVRHRRGLLHGRWARPQPLCCEVKGGGGGEGGWANGGSIALSERQCK